MFERLQTQWRVGFGGATGLDYAAAYPLIDRATSDPEHWDRLFDDLRVLERSALKTMDLHRPKN